jgi:hypothetical protein
MRYVQPQITGTFDAVSTIQGFKDGMNHETGSESYTLSAAYPADE